MYESLWHINSTLIAKISNNRFASCHKPEKLIGLSRTMDLEVRDGKPPYISTQHRADNPGSC